MVYISNYLVPPPCITIALAHPILVGMKLCRKFEIPSMDGPLSAVTHFSSDET